MTYLADLSMTISLILAMLGAFYAILQINKNNITKIDILEKASFAISACFIFASIVLFFAFWSYDFSLKYVHDYSDLNLPLFYRITAFWAGQAGSLLFWALSLVLCGAYFQTTASYKSLTKETRAWYFLFYFAILAFLALLLSTHNDPFDVLNPVPSNGRRLNPLLQNPGMIFHPPLLLLGYGGFTIPACLALAQAMTYNPQNKEVAWHLCTKPLILLAWLLLTAGIVLGAWWAYMKPRWAVTGLGIQWKMRLQFLGSLELLLFTLALLNNIKIKDIVFIHFSWLLPVFPAFFATWLVRGNVVDSVHAFGSGGVGPFLFSFVVLGTISSFLVVLNMKNRGENFSGLELKKVFFFLLLLSL